MNVNSDNSLLIRYACLLQRTRKLNNIKRQSFVLLSLYNKYEFQKQLHARTDLFCPVPSRDGNLILRDTTHVRERQGQASSDMSSKRFHWNATS